MIEFKQIYKDLLEEISIKESKLFTALTPLLDLIPELNFSPIDLENRQEELKRNAPKTIELLAIDYSNNPFYLENLIPNRIYREATIPNTDVRVLLGDDTSLIALEYVDNKANTTQYKTPVVISIYNDRIDTQVSNIENFKEMLEIVKKACDNILGLRYFSTQIDLHARITRMDEQL